MTTGGRDSRYVHYQSKNNVAVSLSCSYTRSEKLYHPCLVKRGHMTNLSRLFMITILVFLLRVLSGMKKGFDLGRDQDWRPGVSCSASFSRSSIVRLS